MLRTQPKQTRHQREAKMKKQHRKQACDPTQSRMQQAESEQAKAKAHRRAPCTELQMLHIQMRQTRHQREAKMTQHRARDCDPSQSHMQQMRSARAEAKAALPRTELQMLRTQPKQKRHQPEAKMKRYSAQDCDPNQSHLQQMRSKARTERHYYCTSHPGRRLHRVHKQ